MAHPPREPRAGTIEGVARLAKRATATLRRLPDFIIIGGMKCGTSSLYHALRHHGDILPAAHKEVHYFDYPTNYRHGPSWYRAHFPVRATRLSGEASPYYSYHPLVPGRMAALLPRVKLIVLLRNPIDRAYSHYQHNRRLGFEHTATFEEAIALEAERLDGERERIVRDPTYYSHHHQHSSYLDRGDYVSILMRWRRHFDERQMLILKSEELFTDPGRTLARVHAFLGVRHHHGRDFHAMNAGRYEPLQGETRAWLARHFAASNSRLGDLLGHDMGWRDA